MLERDANETPEAAFDAYLAALRLGKVASPAEWIERLTPTLSGAGLPERLAQIDRLKGWLDGFRPFPAAALQELKRLYDVRFTYHTNALEGNTLTQSETELVLEKGVTVGGKTLKEHLEVVGHKEAIDYMEELAGRDAIIGEREIRDLHNLILRGIHPQEAGRYRRVDVRAAGTEHVYPPNYRVSELMERFIVWLRSEETQALHPVERAAEAHYRLVSIHPFQDGNGRTARLLMNLLLIQRGFPIVVLTNERRKEYIDALIYGQTQEDDVRPLTELITQATRASLLDYLQILSTAQESRGRGQAFYIEALIALPNR